MKLVGKVKEIHRYPVKSMGGELLQEAQIGPYGIIGDRFFAFKQNAKYVTVEKLPQLLDFKASLKAEGDEFAVLIKDKEGKELGWDDPQLMESIPFSFEKGEVETVVTSSLEGMNWEDHILFVSTSSVHKVGEMNGTSNLDVRRFRPNIVIELESGLPFEEEEWIGKKLVIGEAAFVMNQHCERCAYVNVDPENSSNKDTSILKTIVKERQQNLGVYASVVQTGNLKLGDSIYLED